MGAIDAVTAEVVRNALSMAAQEGGVVVVQASHSTFIQSAGRLSQRLCRQGPAGRPIDGDHAHARSESA